MPVSDGVPAAETIAGVEAVVEFEARSAVATAGVDEGNRFCDEVRQIGCICQCLFRACIIANMHV
jgi:hypothetical protein